LNDDYEGGNFVVAGKTFRTAAGSALIFPSNFMYPHEVIEISEGTRYSVTCWLM
jgi:predicted 2-oxoglutarate/Fe(II)-dependent dioxygenase YbiX